MPTQYDVIWGGTIQLLQVHYTGSCFLWLTNSTIISVGRREGGSGEDFCRCGLQAATKPMLVVSVNDIVICATCKSNHMDESTIWEKIAWQQENRTREAECYLSAIFSQNSTLMHGITY